MALLIHLGVRESEFDVMRNQIIRMLPNANFDLVKTELAWDSNYTETFLDNPIHCVIKTVSPMFTTNMLVTDFIPFLVPLSGGEKDGVIFYVTDHLKEINADDVHEYEELRYPPNQFA